MLAPRLLCLGALRRTTAQVPEQSLSEQLGRFVAPAPDLLKVVEVQFLNGTNVRSAKATSTERLGILVLLSFSQIAHILLKGAGLGPRRASLLDPQLISELLAHPLERGCPSLLSSRRLVLSLQVRAAFLDTARPLQLMSGLAYKHVCRFAPMRGQSFA